MRPLPDLRPWISGGSYSDRPGNVRDRHRTSAICQYEEAIDLLMPVAVDGFDNYPCVIHAWDNSPRSGRNGLVLHGSTPELFRRVLRGALAVRARVPVEEKLIFLKSWNEWAEGNHLEPDLKFGRGYLEVIKEEISHSAAGGAGPNLDMSSAHDAFPANAMHRRPAKPVKCKLAHRGGVPKRRRQ
jgi:hypothetical protein